jgi:hypothetical protein
MRSRTVATLALGSMLAAAPLSAATFLNYTNSTIELISPGSLTGGVIGNAIDRDAVTNSDLHSQASHVWVSGNSLNLGMTFNQDYDLSAFHFWNYFGESFDVDSIDLTYLDNGGNSLGSDLFSPALGQHPSLAESFAIDVPSVRRVEALLSGTNGQVDFQNLGFTGTALGSTPGPIDPPAPPPGTPAPIPVPATLPLLFAALAGGFALRGRGRGA